MLEMRQERSRENVFPLLPTQGRLRSNLGLRPIPETTQALQFQQISPIQNFSAGIQTHEDGSPLALSRLRILVGSPDRGICLIVTSLNSQ